MALSLDISHEKGRWSFAYRPHVLATIGKAFLSFGLGALTAPWWLPVLSSAIGTTGIVIDDASYWVGVPLVIMGVSILLYKYLVVDRKLAKISADQKMLIASPLKIDRIRFYLSDLVDDHSYRSSLDTIFRDSYTIFRKSEFRFQYEETDAAYGRFVECASRLHLFVQGNFFVFPDDQGLDANFRYCLWPDLNMDRNMTFYDAEKTARYQVEKNELHRLTQETQNSFEKFVAHLKQMGHV